jgi:kynureninase
LNSGPGGISGIYVNSKHFNKIDKRLEGWWGNKLSTRFEMKKKIDPDLSAEGWVISNPPVILLDIHLASLEIFNKVGLNNIFSKSKFLTQFLYKGLINIKNFSKHFDIITPESPDKRGAQLSLYFHNNSDEIFKKLSKKFVIDFRKPNVLRVAPVPLYNSFEEVHEFVNELDLLLNS